MVIRRGSVSVLAVGVMLLGLFAFGHGPGRGAHLLDLDLVRLLLRQPRRLSRAGRLEQQPLPGRAAGQGLPRARAARHADRPRPRFQHRAVGDRAERPFGPLLRADPAQALRTERPKRLPPLQELDARLRLRRPAGAAVGSGAVDELTAEEIVRILELEPLPGEGGMFRNTLDDGVSTAIYFLIERDRPTMLHRLPGPEMFHFYAGAPARLLVLSPGGGFEQPRARHRPGRGPAPAAAGRGRAVAGGRDARRLVAARDDDGAGLPRSRTSSWPPGTSCSRGWPHAAEADRAPYAGLSPDTGSVSEYR